MMRMQRREGFTLIELLIVVVIIGILAAIAIPKFSATREKAFYSAMKSDLRNLASQQEIYYSSGKYAYTADETNSELGFTQSEGVAVDVTTGNTTGWAATATHNGTGTFGCAIYYGFDEGATEAPTVPGGTGTPDNVGVVDCAE